MELEEGQKRYKEFLINPQRDYHMSDSRKKELESFGIDVNNLELKARISVINRYVINEHMKISRAS